MFIPPSGVHFGQRTDFEHLRDLGCCHDSWALLKGRMGNAAVCNDLVYGRNTWPLRAEAVRRHSVLQSIIPNHCLVGTAGGQWPGTSS